MVRRSGLGKGLGALIPGGVPESDGDEPAVSDAVFRDVPIESIRVNTFQPRSVIDTEELEPLADSIRELGVLQPILVRKADAGYELIAGERRWRAAQLAGLSSVPVILREAEDVHSLEQALVENLHRKDLNSLDEAAAYRQLIDDFRMTHEEVGKRVGKSRAAVSNLLRLLTLPPRAQRLLGEGRISEGHARALLGCTDEKFQIQLAERTANEALSVRAVEDAVRLRNELARPEVKKRSAVAPQRTSAPTLEWQERLTTHLDTRVSISLGSKRGKIVIDFADVDDLDRITKIIGTPSSNSAGET